MLKLESGGVVKLMLEVATLIEDSEAVEPVGAKNEEVARVALQVPGE